MSKEEILKKAIDLISGVQNNTSLKDDYKELTYLMAYNDGVIDMAYAMIKIINPNEKD